MDKPLSMLINEFKEKMENTINSSGLPVYIVEMIMKDYCNQLTLLSINMVEKEKTEYLQEIETDKEEDKK